MKRILCAIPTRGRYDLALPMALSAVANQTMKPDHLIIFDDNDEPVDIREIEIFRYLLHTLDYKGISWEVIFGRKKGQHHSHQIANTLGWEWVWRVDDDTVPDPNVLETLWSYVTPTVGAVGGAILTPPFAPVHGATGKIENISAEPSIQWDYIREAKSVDHLHCSFLYRAGIHDYNLSLSRAAFREETLFTYGLKQRGYEILVVPNANTWHYKNNKGGVRPEMKEMFDRDDLLFRTILGFDKQTICILDNGMGDHIVFKKVLPEIKNPVIFSCYPEIVPGRSIAEAMQLFGDIGPYNVYQKMDQWNWKGSLEEAFRKMYATG